MRITPNVKCQRVLVLLCGWSILCDWLVSSVTTILHNLLLGHISLLCIVTDRVAWYVCLSCEPSTDQDAVWDVDSGGPKEPSIIRYGSRSPPMRRNSFDRVNVCTADGCLKEQDSNSATEFELWRNAGPSAF